MPSLFSTLRSQWQLRLGRWLNQRIPASPVHVLSLKSVFIFPSQFGFGFLIMCACLFVLGTNYQNNLMLFLSNFLIALFLLQLFVSYLNFSRLVLKAAPVSPVFANGHARVTLTLEYQNAEDSRGHKNAASGILHVGWWGEKTFLEVDLDSAQNQCSLPYFPAARGIYPLPRITCYSEYPLGFYRCWSHLDFAQELTVYPQPVPCQIELDYAHTDDDNNVTEQIGYDDFESLRAYQAGEPLHRVAWKNVAKGGDWVSKKFSELQADTGYLTLNQSAQDVEHELSKLCFQILTLSEQHRLFGLTLGSLKIPPGRGDHHKHTCLSALARYPLKAQSL